MHGGVFITAARERSSLPVAELADGSGYAAIDIEAWELRHEDVSWRA